ncbi:MAG: hypothetical protein ACI8PT_003548 [Gammaproteobacteria bacterium]|jgi:hypothetical protein
MTRAANTVISLVVLGGLLTGCAGGRTDDLVSPSAAPTVPEATPVLTVDPDERRESLIRLAVWIDRLALESDIAKEHLDFALRKPDDLDWVHRHLRHMRHALAPETEEDGPGLGSGVTEAVRGIATSTRGYDRWTVQSIARTGANVARWTNDAILLSENALAEKTDTKQVMQWVRTIEVILRYLREGHDANRDGLVSWSSGESGVRQLQALVSDLQRRG